MPGAYTHITMANEASDRMTMERFDMPPAAITACNKWLKYCELGAVSPDLPFLQFASSAAKQWANTMHYTKTDGVIRSAIAQLRDGDLPGSEKERGLAWLLGYTAHVVMDCTLHPVVNLRVGDYATNAREHRVCEMHQDVFIFDRLQLSVELSEHLDEGLAACRVNGELDPVIVRLWSNALSETHGQAFAESAPKPSEWHVWFARVVDTSDGPGVFRAISRHIAPNSGYIYPTFGTIDRSFIEDLATPANRSMSFPELFEMAKGNVCRTWRVVARGALGLDESYRAVLQHCDLDTGLNTAGNMIFWEGV